MSTEDLQQIQNLVTSSRVIWILTHKNPSIDVMASALSLYLGLIKMGKDVSIAMETEPLVEVSNLVGIDQVKTGFAGKNLVISYDPYQLGDIQTVSYLEDEGSKTSFKLTLTPREGLKLDAANFNFSQTGAAADLIFTMDVVQPQDLGKLYDPNVFGAAQIINIDNHDENKDYGRFNLVEPNAATVSEITTFFLRAINAQLDPDVSGNLYQGLTSGSQNFQAPKVGAATFEAAAICLRSGAKPVSLNKPTRGTVPTASQMNPLPAQPTTVTPTYQPAEPARNTPARNALQTEAGGKPADWNTPKVYRGTSVV